MRLVNGILADSGGRPDAILIDLNTVIREPEAKADSFGMEIREIDFRDWVSAKLKESGIINIEAIRRSATLTLPGEAIMINARGFGFYTIHNALKQFCIGLYSLNAWPSAVVLVCDDALIYHSGPALSRAFYIQPDVIGAGEVVKMVKRKMAEAWVLRLFGKKVALILLIVLEAREWFTLDRWERAFTFGKRDEALD